MGLPDGNVRAPPSFGDLDHDQEQIVDGCVRDGRFHRNRTVWCFVLKVNLAILGYSRSLSSLAHGHAVSEAILLQITVVKGAAHLHWHDNGTPACLDDGHEAFVGEPVVSEI